MKNDLIILKYKTEPVVGTKTHYDLKTFFGSKMINIENSIKIDNSSIQYSEVYDEYNKKNMGYQYYNDTENIERIYLKSLYELKNNNHNVSLTLGQTQNDLSINTRWTFSINWINILTEYLFYKLKEARTFKVIKYNDTMLENINLFIYDYIKENLLSRYKFTSIDLWVEYAELNNDNINNDTELSYNPIYDISIKKDSNKITNINSFQNNDNLIFYYNQIDTSKTKKIKYYFDLNIERI